MGTVISLDEALAAVLAAPCGRMPGETVSLQQAMGRRLAAPILADGPWPATDRSAMDGFAVRAAAGLPAGTRVPVLGQSLAGKPFVGAPRDGCAIEIMTGAVVPEWADAVVPVELTSGFGQPHVEFTAPVVAGANIRKRGSEKAQGEVVLPAGARIRAAEIGALAVLGHAQLAVLARPKVAILATGDEVVPMEQQPLPHQVRESNSWALLAQVAECGAEGRRLAIAGDEPGPLRALLAEGLREADVLLTIGGISKGTHDLVHTTLAELGVEPIFHGIQLKPGKPTFFGQLESAGRRTSVFGLPGNPASTFTVFDLLVRPMLQRLLGQQPKAWSLQARLVGSWRPNPRLQAVPVELGDRDGEFVARVLPPSPSGDPFSLVPGTAYALLPPGSSPESLGQARIVGYADGWRLP